MIIPQYICFVGVLFFLSEKSVYGGSSTISFQEIDDCECGKANTFASRIIGGQETDPNEYPWMVALFYQGQMHCGGSLINDRYILTAGHCLKWAKKEMLSVILGMHDRVLVETERRGGLILEIEEIKIHEKFKSLKLHDTDDIGLIKLKTAVPFNNKMMPVCLPKNTGETYAGKIAQITGWGRIGQKDTPSRLLKEADVKVVSNWSCKKAPIVGKHILDSMMCAYKEEEDACQGDSGGPMIFETDTGKVEQIGIVSWGIGCATKGLPGVYVRVSSYLPWIASHTKDGFYCKNLT